MLANASRMQLAANASRTKTRAYGSLDRFVGWSRADEAVSEITQWSGYRPSPLLDWPRLAEANDVASIRCKYEGERFGLGSFKALGGAYAVLRAVNARLAATGAPPHQAGRAAALQDITVATASDGNHGLSVAWGARRAGCRSVVFLHENVSVGRERLIAGMGATVRRVAGNYDASTQAADKIARQHGWLLVADTASQFEENPIQVMAGYGVLVEELTAQYGDRGGPTHIFVQGGCGGLAAAVCGLFRQRDNSDAAPLFVVVEPEEAACLFQSARAGRPVTVDGALNTIMSGLSVGEVSAVAWPVLEYGADFFMTIPDDLAIGAMRLFARGAAGDPPVEIGDSGVAGLAGFLAANGSREARAALGIGRDSRILVIATEGPVDRESYDRLIAGDTRDETFRELAR